MVCLEKAGEIYLCVFEKTQMHKAKGKGLKKSIMLLLGFLGSIMALNSLMRRFSHTHIKGVLAFIKVVEFREF